MDQEGLKAADFGKALGVCFQLESLDISGCHYITDEFFMHLSSGELTIEGVVTKPGLQNLVTVKMSFLKLITDTSVGKITGMSSKLEHLEIAGCELLSEYCLENTLKTVRNLNYVDVNHIPALTPALYEILKGHRPDLMVRRFLYTEVD